MNTLKLKIRVSHLKVETFLNDNKRYETYSNIYIDAIKI